VSESVTQTSCIKLATKLEFQEISSPIVFGGNLASSVSSMPMSCRQHAKHGG